MEQQQTPEKVSESARLAAFNGNDHSFGKSLVPVDAQWPFLLKS
jgi:hypothetical protein